MKTAYLISTGTELLLGTTNDSNSVFLATSLSEKGIKVIGKTIVGDNREGIRMAFNNAIATADIIISSGGLGPTKDDLTKEVACQVMGCEMLINQAEVKKLEEFFAQRQRPMPLSNLKQAFFPAEAEVIPNPLGTAPGMYLKKNNKILILLPGPPREMKHMFKDEIEPRLERDFPQAVNRALRKTIKILGPGESQLEQTLEGIIGDESGLNIALLAVEGEIHIKLSADDQDESNNHKIMEKVCRNIGEALDRHIVAYDDDTLLTTVVAYLIDAGRKLAVAESCTGGLLAKMLSDLPGSSNYFWGSVTSYSDEAKMLYLDVKRETLGQHGAVSPEVALEMASGMQKKSGVDLVLSITGFAGPDAATNDKPVGLVYICLVDGEFSQVKEMHFLGSRQAIRMLAAKTALDLLRRYLKYGG